MKQEIKRLADGILFQFLMVGSLSFSHIHDVVAAHGQAGWKAWLYPLSIDLLTVAAFRKIRAHVGGVGVWTAFLLGLAASLAANIIESWNATPTGRAIDVAIGVWPAVALLVCTLIGHDGGPAESANATATQTATNATAPRDTVPAATVAARQVVSAPVAPNPVAPPTTPVAPATTTTRVPQPRHQTTPKTPARPTKAPDTSINVTVLRLLAQHGADLKGPAVAAALGLHRSNGSIHLKRVKTELLAGKLDTHPEAAPAKAALSSSLSSSPQATTTTAP